MTVSETDKQYVKLFSFQIDDCLLLKHISDININNDICHIDSFHTERGFIATYSETEYTRIDDTV
jgi:hypothetical protein